MDARTEAEDGFKDKVIGLAHLRRWKVVHFRPALTTRGWRTAIQGDRGFPDLVLARDGDVLMVELKSEKGRMRPGQAEWGRAIGENYRLWRPSDWDEIVETLSQVSNSRRENGA